MKKYKLIALDLDGTLLNEQKEISKENLEAIQLALRAGVQVIFSTGRGIHNVIPYLDAYALDLPVVSVNGSEVWKKRDVLWKRHLLSIHDVKLLHQLAVDQEMWWWSYAVEGSFNRQQWVTSIDDIQWLKFGMQTENQAKLAHIKADLLQRDRYEITNSHPDNIEINPKGISKASGVMEICQLYGIQMDEVIAIGDSENDLSMIRAAGLGVAMGNGQAIVKQHAKVITRSNDEHGVAEIIHHYVR